ncbi:MAG: hypothetical protein A3C07_03235 [Candidatus Sungbacteria bacterium RIFCSPHIGHO2_02_FULL_47_11]|uniref:Uncharacterized protein n=1 Tax=Candidatus Sungbacteria bacterium RIFCSPHIGHO2_02_FULL_47_11 TaxID=1802270 RepID=A0A1G2KLG7_9BACT|nr:MAG: hypothetical protein A3C07_03235 [Candidatus Sungbacteria bacterium RIFCSPHIGHO2_02_FULL_47_11]
MKVVASPIKKAEIAGIAKNQFGDLVKAAVDVEKEIMAIGGELHADEEALLIARGSRQENLWGINFYPDRSEDEWIEFDSMINVRPSQGNRSRSVESQAIQGKIKAVIKKLVS